jgi:hypothetical protein
LCTFKVPKEKNVLIAIIASKHLYKNNHLISEERLIETLGPWLYWEEHPADNV